MSKRPVLEYFRQHEVIEQAQSKINTLGDEPGVQIYERACQITGVVIPAHVCLHCSVNGQQTNIPKMTAEELNAVYTAIKERGIAMSSLADQINRSCAKDVQSQPDGSGLEMSDCLFLVQVLEAAGQLLSVDA